VTAYRSEVRRSTVAFAALATGAIGLAVTLGPWPAAGDDVERVGFRLVVGHVSTQPGPVDPEAIDLYNRLREDFRYESLRVLKRRRLRLGMEEVGGIDLPNGKRVRIRPLHLGESGVLVAVDIDPDVQMDLRIRNHRKVVLGTDRYDGGKLVVTLQPDY
jgi:hypothetical protein